MNGKENSQEETKCNHHIQIVGAQRKLRLNNVESTVIRLFLFLQLSLTLCINPDCVTVATQARSLFIALSVLIYLCIFMTDDDGPTRYPMEMFTMAL
mmetsp:Transcript_10135/g.12527  ORF Transcript_10135/g.12527 Transcript_10135/m.12527 type:complete len:97 (+) Transcript_10135:626-916(+)